MSSDPFIFGEWQKNQFKFGNNDLSPKQSFSGTLRVNLISLWWHICDWNEITIIHLLVVCSLYETLLVWIWIILTCTERYLWSLFLVCLEQKLDMKGVWRMEPVVCLPSRKVFLPAPWYFCQLLGKDMDYVYVCLYKGINQYLLENEYGILSKTQMDLPTGTYFQLSWISDCL